MDRKKLNIEFDENVFKSSLSDHACEAGCYKAIQELLKNSHVSKTEVDAFVNIIQQKDDQIKAAEDKLCALEIELTVYKERANNYDQKIKDKDNLITALSTDSCSTKKQLDELREMISVLQNQQDNNSEQIVEMQIQLDKLKSSDDAEKHESKTENLQPTTDQLNPVTIVGSDDQVEKKQKCETHEYESLIKKLEEQIADLNLKVQEKGEKLEENDNNYENELRINIPYGTIKKFMYVPKTEPFEIKMITIDNNHGAVLIQNRVDKNVSFERDWNEYYQGFGDIEGGFWLGLENIHRITTHERHYLLIYMVDYQKKKFRAIYDDFVVAGKDEDYKLKSLGKFGGNAGDMLRVHENRPFRISDTVNSGWWFLNESISHCNLNGKYSTIPNSSWDGLYWGLKEWGNTPNNVYSVQMAIVPFEQKST